MLSDLVHRLRALFKRDAVEREIDDELRFHFDRQVEQYERAVAGHADAVRRARLEVGGLDQLKEEYRDALGVRLVHDLRRDVVLSIRSLRATPIVTMVALLSLALAIGANTTIFSILNSLVLRPLPIRDPANLALVTDTNASRLRAWTYSQWRQFQQRSDLFEGLAAWSFTRFNLAPGGETQFIDGLWVTGSFFDTLGVRVAAGRPLAAFDDRRGGASDGPVAVISDRFWRRQFGAAPDVLGRSLRLDDGPFTIVGITPPEFFGPAVGRAFDVIVPLEQEPLLRGHDTALVDPGPNFLSIVARLRPGQTLAGATADLRAVQDQIRAATIGDLERVQPSAMARYLRDPFTVIPAPTGDSSLRRQYERPLLTIMAVVAVVLLIACMNVANLLLARAIARRHELGVRRALGASRWRLARQLLVESLTLSCAGAALGLAIAVWASRALVGQLGASVALDVPIDMRVLAFTAGVVVFTTMFFGTVPAFRMTRVAPVDALKDHGRAIAERSRGLSNWLVAAQVALSVVLVVAAGLFVRSFFSVVMRPMGFDPQRVLVVSIDSQRAGIDSLQRIDLYARVREAARSAAGVGGAAMSFLTPGGSGGFTPPVQISGVPVAQTQNGQVFANLISSQWFKVLGTRLVAGRDFTDLDRKGAPRVAVVNQSFERKFFGGNSALGRTISLYAGGTAVMPPMAIVGVVEDAVYNTPLEPVPPTWYAPLDQFDVPMALASPMFRVMNLNVSATSGSPVPLTKNIADAISGVNPNLALTFRPLADQLHTALTQQRLMAWLAGAFGVVALLLAGLGLYGVTAYAVSRRRTEIGIRTALGAEPGRLVRMVLARVAGLVGVGVAAGTVMSVFLSPVVGSLMYGIGPRDPLIIAGAAMMLVVVGVAAGWLPARHVARIDPVSVLRES